MEEKKLSYSHTIKNKQGQDTWGEAHQQTLGILLFSTQGCGEGHRAT
jgi:hypothetical protein